MKDANRTFKIKIDKLVYGGDGLGRLPDGRAIFVPFTLPDETVIVDIIQDKQRYAIGRVKELLEASDRRIQPRCIHFENCGGCHYQNLSYNDQLFVKKDIVVDQLMRITKLDSPPVKPVMASPEEWNYRNRVKFHLTADGKLGYLKSYEPRVFAIQECHLPFQEINLIWPELSVDPGSALETIEVRSGAEEDILLVLAGPQEDLPIIELDSPISIVHQAVDNQVVIAGEDRQIQKINDVSFQVSAGSFFQINTSMAEKLIPYMLNELNLSENQVFFDLYCGVGLFTRFIAPKVKECVGVEFSESAAEDFIVNLTESENVTLYVGNVDEIIQHLKEKPDIVLVDPPRAGLGNQGIDSIVDHQPQKIAYVSCDLATFARDAKKLIEKGYTLKFVQPLDMFPQTYHIETFSIFEK